MSSAANKIGDERGNGGGVVLVNMRVLATDEADDDGKINEGFYRVSE